MLVDGDVRLDRLVSTKSQGESVSFDGELGNSSVVDAIDSEFRASARGLGLAGSTAGDDAIFRGSAVWFRVLCESCGGVFAGEDFCGEMDRARSVYGAKVS